MVRSGKSAALLTFATDRCRPATFKLSFGVTDSHSASGLETRSLPARTHGRLLSVNRVSIFVAALFCWGATALAAEAAPVKPLRVLLITGGCCHDYPAQKDILAEGLRERANVEVTVVLQGGDRTDSRIALYENPDWAKGYDVVIHDECFADVKDPAWLDGILKPHRAGVPAVVLHCAMHCYRTGSDEWFKFCGVTSRQHGAQYPHSVFNRDGANPIMQGFGAAWANPAGELYWIEKVWPTAHVLGSAKNQENGHDEPCIWVNDYQGTRVFGTTLGHHNETVSSPTYLDFVTRGTLWAAGHLEPAYLKPIKPKLVPVNLAQGKPATASTTQEGHPAGHAVDGDSSSRWCASDGSPNQWWQVDLGSAQKTTGILLDWEQGGAVYRYRVEGATDGQTWHVLVDGSNNTKPSANEHRWAASEVRQVRVHFLGAATGVWGSLKEVKVFGEQMQEINPAKASQAEQDALLGDVKVPEGFEKTIFAAPPAVNYPVFVSASPDGTVYVSSDKNGSLDRAPHRGSIIRLRDLDGDGRADESKLFVADVDSPRGLVWDRDRLYVLHPPHLSVYIDKDGDGIADEEKILVKNMGFTFKDRPADHTSNGLELGVDGWIYCAMGDFGFMEAEGTDGRKMQLRGGAILRVRTDGTGLEFYSRGTRNILEAEVTPTLDVFARDNTNDGDGWDVRLHHSTALVNHGYPSLYQHFSDELMAPLADYGGGSGCGGLFLDEPGFPEGYGYALYTADWGREWIYRHRLTPKGASFTIDQNEFVHVPRATDLDVDGSSHLYISSWKDAVFTYAGEKAGFLARVTPKGYVAEPIPNFAKASDAELVKLLLSPSHRRRLEAQRTLIARGLNDASVKGLSAVTMNPGNPIASRVAAIFALKQGLHAAAVPLLLSFVKNDSIREFALRALTDRLEELAGVPAEPILAGLKDANPRVRREAINSVARLGKLENAAALVPLLDDADPRLSHMTVHGLAQLKAADVLFSVVDANGDNATATARTHAFYALYLLHEPAVIDGLISRLGRETSALRRRDLLTALCRLYFTEGEWKGESWGTRPDTSGPYYQTASWSETTRIDAALKAELAKATPADASFLLGEFNRHKIPVGDALDSVVALAAKDSTLATAAVAQLSRAERIPPAAVPILIPVATAADTEAVTRAQAVIALAKSDSAEALPALLLALPRLQAQKDAAREVGQAREAFLNSPRLEAQHTQLEQIAAQHSGDGSLWADAVLLRISDRKNAAPETKALVTKALNDGWAEPVRRTQILRAVALANHRAYRDLVIAALDDHDASVLAAAHDAAVALRLLEATKKAAATGPLIGALKTEQVIAAVVQQHGDVALGEQLFTRQACVTCHTVKSDQPLKGPFLGNIATTYPRPALAEAILLPNKTIAQGFVTHHFELKDGTELEGFVTQEAADKVTIRNAAAQEVVIVVADIAKREKLDRSIMPEGIVANLTVKEFASLLDYLEALAKK